MTLGERIRMVRKQKGLSQAELAGDQITRNMLSLIESGKSHPSVATLCYLAQRLQVPAGALLEEQGQLDTRLAQAEAAFRAQEYAACLALVSEREADALRWMGAVSAMRLGRAALEGARPRAAAEYLQQARVLAQNCLYWREDWELELLQRLAALELGEEVAPLPLADPLAPLLEARRLLRCGEWERAEALAAQISIPYEQSLLVGLLLLRRETWREAKAKLQYAEQLLPESAEPTRKRELYAALENCCQKLEDYQSAYQYASKQLQLQQEI